MTVFNGITAVLNFIAFLRSIPIIAAGIWLAFKPDNECTHLFRWPAVILGFLVLLVSLAGCLGAYWYKETLLAFYLCCMAILIGLLLFLLVFALVVTSGDGGYEVPKRGCKEYKLEGFSSWPRDHVVNSENWQKISACLAQSSDVCAKMNHSYISVDQFFMAHISPLQARCCKPPTACGYSYVNPRLCLWLNPTSPSGDPDCYPWNNDQNQLCYNCNSCKAGLLGSNLRKEWWKANIILIVAVVVLIWVYIIACSAFRNAQTEDLFRRYRRGWV